MNSTEHNPNNAELPFANDPFPLSEADENRPTYLGGEYKFKFHGKGLEYFGIWIVNILLTIATLSLYAPWAKVRRLRYFYSNTQFFRRFFDFTGIPTRILVGRLIAIGIWAAIAVASTLNFFVAIFGGLIIYIAFPWLVRSTIRFNARNSKFGNSRFYFAGTTKDAYIKALFAFFIAILSLGILTPVAIWIYKKYTLDHLYVGQLKFALNASWTKFMTAVWVPLIIIMLLGGLLSYCILYWFNLNNIIGVDIFINSIFLGYIFIFLFLGPLIKARLFILTWNNTSLGQSQFKSTANQWRFAWIVGTNLILKLLSLGLLSAWAAIRITKYQIDSLSLLLNDDPNKMLNIAQTDHSAVAEELSDIFDIDISL